MVARHGSLCQFSSTRRLLADLLSARGLMLATLMVAAPALTIGQAASGAEGEVSETLADQPLAIHLADDSPVVRPGKSMDISIKITGLANHAGKKLTLRCGLYQVDHGETVGSSQREVTLDKDGNLAGVSIDDILPMDEGVYEFRCELSLIQEHLWSRLRRREPPIAENRTTIIALNSDSDSETDSLANNETAWKTIAEIRPSQTTWSAQSARTVNQWLPKQATRLIPGAIGVTDELSVSEESGETVSLLAPQNVFQTELPIRDHHLPHKITIRYPAALAGSMRIDVAAGDNRSGLPVSLVLTRDHVANNLSLPTSDGSSDQPAKSAWATHTIVYYPSGNDQIWVTNLSSSSAVAFESIRVEAGPTRLVSSPNKLPDKRIAALYIDASNWSTLYSEDISRRDVFATCSRRTILLHRVWVATERAADYAIANGMNGIVVPVQDETDLWFDGQAFFDQPARPEIRQDLLEICQRIIARHHLQFWIHFDVSQVLSTTDDTDGENEVNLMFAKPEVRASLIAMLRKLCRGERDQASISGVILQIDSDEPQQPIALETVREFVGQVKRGVPEEVRIHVAAEGAVAGDSDEFSIVRSFVHESAERLTQLVALQHRLTSVKRAESIRTTPIIGQADGEKSGGTVATRLSGDAVRLFDQANPSVLLVKLPITALSLSSELADVLTSFCSAPPDQGSVIEPDGSAAQTVRMQTATFDNQTYVTLLSLAPWDNVVRYRSEPDCHWETISGNVVIESATRPLMTHQLTLPGGHVAVLKSRSPSAKIEAWSVSVRGEDEAVETIKQQVTSVVQRIGMLANPKPYEGLINGGFERSGGIGLVGWLHAQHPPGCVRVDQQERSEGSQAVMLTTDEAVSTRTWLVSEMIPPPQSGRLSVSLSCRGEQRDDDSVHRLRVSLEATEHGRPIRHSAEFDIARNGKWDSRELILEADGIDPQRVESLRLTIDSLSGGRVWLDDVRLHDYFPTAKERAELQSQAFLAVQGLQRGNLTSSARLLQNHWAHFLTTDTSSEKITPPAESAAEKEAAEKEMVPGVADRMRSWLPRPLRF